jgi:hypothetical protein
MKNVSSSSNAMDAQVQAPVEPSGTSFERRGDHVPVVHPRL